MKLKWWMSIGQLTCGVLTVPGALAGSTISAAVCGAAVAGAFWSWLYWDMDELLQRSHKREDELHKMLRGVAE